MQAQAAEETVQAQEAGAEETVQAEAAGAEAAGAEVTPGHVAV